jgi:hypothetical protein|tara:strand:+ start:1155 stop:1304 length:150 start_codon:yes stop_codon:yes gene_type:complete
VFKDVSCYTFVGLPDVGCPMTGAASTIDLTSSFIACFSYWQKGKESKAS